MTQLAIPEIETERFLLRQFTLDDLDEWTRLIFYDLDILVYGITREQFQPGDAFFRVLEYRNHPGESSEPAESVNKRSSS